MPTPSGGSRRLLGAVVGIGISLALLVVAARGVDIGQAMQLARNANAGLLLAAVVIATSCFLLRTVRWRVLLQREDGTPLGFGPLWHAVAAGFMANNLLPFRAGEVIRAVVIGRLGPVAVPSAITSIALERVFDGLTVILLLAIGLFSANLPPDLAIKGVSIARAATVAGVLSVGLLAAVIVLVAAPTWSGRLAARFLPASLSTKVQALVASFAAGADVLRSPARVLATIVWSLAHWVVNAAAFWVAARAFGIVVPFGTILLVQGVVIFGIAVPSSPGFVGVFEAAIVETLALVGVDRGVAFSFAATYHVLTFIPITLLGLWSLSRASLSLGGAAEAAEATR